MGLDMMLYFRAPGEELKEVMYWRKANAVHNWFVENIQNGVDECKAYAVATSELMELRNLCEQVLEDRLRADELLPTTSGFFFGSTAYDDWYFSNLESTVQGIDRLLNEYGDKGVFVYQSSW